MLAVLVVYVVLAYFAVGLMLGSAFALRGASAIDANARGAGPLFKVVIIPGAAALWPLVLTRWKRTRGSS